MGFYDQYAGWGEESTWATEVARAQFARIYGGSFLRHQVPQDPLSALGRRDAEFVFLKPESGLAKLIIPLVYDGAGKLLKHCLGAVADAGIGPYTHTHTLSDDPPTGLSVEIHYALPDASNESLRMPGGKVTGFGAEIRVGEEIKLDVDLIGQQVVQGGKTASPTFPDYSSTAVLVRPSQVTATVDATARNLNAMSFRVNNNLDVEHSTLGQQYIREPLQAAGKREVTGTVELEDWVKAEYDKFVGATAAAILVTCTGSGNSVMTIRLNNVQFEGQTPEPVEGGRLPLSLPFRAYHDATYTALEIVETNDTATT